MTERENELTRQANYTNLEGRGSAMSDGPNQPEQQTPSPDSQRADYLSDSELNRARNIFSRLDPLRQKAIDKMIENTFGSLEGDLKDAARGQFAEAEMTVRERNRGKEFVGVPENLVDLAKLIIKQSDPEVWGIGGSKALIEKNEETGEEKVNTANFLDWTRTNMFKVHSFNPTSSVNFFSDLGMSVRNDQWGSQISFYEIAFQESLFLDKKTVEGHEIKVANPEYSALRDQLVKEVFLFQTIRNADILYTQNKGSEKEMQDALAQIHSVSTLTRSDFFEFIMTLPSIHKKTWLDLEMERTGEDKTIQAKKEANFYLGNAVRMALAAYINIFDYEQLKKILETEDGNDPVLFRREYAVYDSITGEQKLEDGNPKMETIVDDPEHPQRRQNWFNEDGSLKEEQKRPGSEFMNYINIFLGPSLDQRQKNEVRERITLSIMEKNGISYTEAKLAEAMAYSMTGFFGVAARNDTQSVAFDWWTRLTNFKDYRKRQKAERRGGAYGGDYNMEGFKRIGLNFFEGARDTKGRSIQEIIQGGKGRNINIDGFDLKDMAVVERDENGDIVFYNQEGQRIENLKARDYKIVDEVISLGGNEKRVQRIKYFDSNGEEVNVGDAKTKMVKQKTATPIEFKADLQKYFVINHVYSGAGVYEHIMKQVQMNFPDMVEGYDFFGNPILDQKKILEVQSGIEHDIRYTLSTWSEINFADKFIMWERKEKRNERGRLIAAGKVNSRYKGRELDEKWNVIGTNEMDEPETYLESREMTILESMFGVDALRFIQYEIEKRGLARGERVERIAGTSFGGKQVTVNVDLSAANEEAFRIAVWRGAFDYLIASEIAAHRDRNSGFEWYNLEKMEKVVHALRGGRFVSPDEIGKIQKETGTKLKWLFAREFTYNFAIGGLEGFWKLFFLIFGDIFKDVAK